MVPNFPKKPCLSHTQTKLKLLYHYHARLLQLLLLTLLHSQKLRIKRAFELEAKPFSSAFVIFRKFLKIFRKFLNFFRKFLKFFRNCLILPHTDFSESFWIFSESFWFYFIRIFSESFWKCRWKGLYISLSLSLSAVKITWVKLSPNVEIYRKE